MKSGDRVRVEFDATLVPGAKKEGDELFLRVQPDGLNQSGWVHEDAVRPLLPNECGTVLVDWHTKMIRFVKTKEGWVKVPASRSIPAHYSPESEVQYRWDQDELLEQKS